LTAKPPGDERPPAPWGSFPLAELCVLAGIVALVVGIVGANPTAIGLGVVLAGLGGLEVSLREHLAGYRSHTTLLAGTAFVLVTGGLYYLGGLILAVCLAAGAVAFLVAFFPVVIDTATGLNATPPELLDLSRSYRASAFKTFLKVRLPMALPFIFAGAKVAITLSVIGAVVGEFVGSDKGLGYVILSATSYWKTELAFSAMILLSLMAIVLFAAVSLVERLACPWLAPEGEA